jgi:allantoinase
MARGGKVDAGGQGIMPDLVIRNGRLALPEGLMRAELSIEGETIDEIAITGIPKGETEVDAKGKVVIPGAIDVHAHIHDPNFLRRETFRAGSLAAAAGGITTLLVMPLDTPVVTANAAKKIIAAGKRASFIDFGLHAGNMTQESIDNVRELASLGIKSFKAFTCSPYLLSPEAMSRLAEEVKKVNGVLFVHAEDEEVLRESLAKLEGRKDSLAHHDARPPEAEEKAVREILELVKASGCRVHLAHITTKKACELIANAKQEHLPVTAEACVHYLLFTRNDIAEKGPYLRVNPSLKSKEDGKALWESLAMQVLDIVSTDHAPGTKREKEVGWTDIWRAQIGIPGVETLLPLLLSFGVGEGRLTLERMVDLISTKPAQIFGMYPKKGTIRKGSDADLVILNFKRKVLRASELHYKVGWTPYEGITLRGYPIITISRGEIVYDDGEILGRPGRGSYLPR